MLSEVRPLSFETELVFIPADEVQFDRRTVLDLFTNLSEFGTYENLQLQSSPPEMSTKRDVGESICRIGKHRLALIEKRPEFSVDRFEQKVEDVVSSLAEVSKNCPPVIMQRCKISGTAQPNNCEHSIELLAGRISGVMEKIEPFGRPPAYFGIRFRFPPARMFDKDDDGEPDEESAIDFDDYVTLRFETYARDVSQVWMEVETMNMFEEVADPKASELFAQNIKRTYGFLSEQAVQFLNQFDEKNHEGEQGDAEQ